MTYLNPTTKILAGTSLLLLSAIAGAVAVIPPGDFSESKGAEYTRTMLTNCLNNPICILPTQNTFDDFYPTLQEITTEIVPSGREITRYSLVLDNLELKNADELEIQVLIPSNLLHVVSAYAIPALYLSEGSSGGLFDPVGFDLYPREIGTLGNLYIGGGVFGGEELLPSNLGPREPWIITPGGYYSSVRDSTTVKTLVSRFTELFPIEGFFSNGIAKVKYEVLVHDVVTETSLIDATAPIIETAYDWPGSKIVVYDNVSQYPNAYISTSPNISIGCPGEIYQSGYIDIPFEKIGLETNLNYAAITLNKILQSNTLTQNPQLADLKKKIDQNCPGEATLYLVYTIPKIQDSTPTNILIRYGQFADEIQMWNDYGNDVLSELQNTFSAWQGLNSVNLDVGTSNTQLLQLMKDYTAKIVPLLQLYLAITTSTFTEADFVYGPTAGDLAGILIPIVDLNAVPDLALWNAFDRDALSNLDTIDPISGILEPSLVYDLEYANNKLMLLNLNIVKISGSTNLLADLLTNARLDLDNEISRSEHFIILVDHATTAVQDNLCAIRNEMVNQMQGETPTGVVPCNNVLIPKDPQLAASPLPLPEKPPVITPVNGVDLTLTLVNGPDSAIAGDTVAVTGTVTNTGTVASAATQVQFALSRNGSYNSVAGESDVLMGSAINAPALAAGASASVSITYTIPDNNSLEGAYQILGIVDLNNQIVEIDDPVTVGDPNNLTGNNLGVGNQITIVPKPVVPPTPPTTPVGVDLLVQNVVYPGVSVAGEVIAVDTTIANNGTQATTGRVMTFFYLSNNTTFERNTDVFLGNTSKNGMAAGEVYTFTKLLTIPSAQLFGDYYILAVTDLNGAIAEVDSPDNLNGNNLGAGSIVSISATNVDLTANITSIPGTIVAGSTVPLTFSIDNLGSNTTSSSVSGLVFLSTDAVWDTGDQIIGAGSFKLGNLTGGQSVVVNKNLPIPSTLTPGSYYILVIVDYADYVIETDDPNNRNGNNLSSAAIIVTAP